MDLTENEIRQNVIDSLRKVYDPEMPSINVLDLGLIYDIRIDKDKVTVDHTLTSMACPFADQICAEIEEAIKTSEGVKTAVRNLVFTPPFSMDMVPEDTKLMMGWY